MKTVRKFVLLSLAAIVLAVPAFSQIAISIGIAPPPLPVYVQPPCPQAGYLWTPGYWAWGQDGYYWIPGTWVMAPSVGLLWTPPYWGWNNGAYAFNAGYWGPTVGFYGGINYGFGYGGVGFGGGYWQGGVFAYNRSVTNINITNVHVYNKTVINNTTINHTSFNGPGGVTARPTAQEQAAMKERHIPPTSMQQQHIQEAAKNPELRLASNHGAPAIAATSKPGSFSGPGVVKANAAGGKIAPETLKATAATAPKTAPKSEAAPKAAPKAAPVTRTNPSTMNNRNNNAGKNTAIDRKSSTAYSQKPNQNKATSPMGNHPANNGGSMGKPSGMSQPAPRPAPQHEPAPQHAAPAPQHAAPAPQHEPAPQHAAPAPHPAPQNEKHK
jgi:hypothetical protein